MGPPACCLCTAKPEQGLEPPLVSGALLPPPGSPVRQRALGGGAAPRAFTPTLCPSPPQQDTLPEFPCTFFPPTPAPTPPRLPPATPAPPRPLIVPKVERLSPPAPSGKEGLKELVGGVGLRGGRRGRGMWGTMSGARMRGTGPRDSLPCVGLSVSPSVPGTGGERRLSAELTSLPGPGALSIRISPPQPMLSRGRPDSKVAPVLSLRSVCSTPGPLALPPRLTPALLPLPQPPDRKPAHHTHLCGAEEALQHQAGL